MSKYDSFLDAPREVQARYYRKKYWRKADALARAYSRLTLTFKERQKNKELKRTLETYKRESLRAKQKGNECVQSLMNMGLFFLLAENDIQSVKIDALTHPDQWKRNLSLRVVLLTIYEWDMGKVTTRGLDELLTRSAVDSQVQTELFSSLRAVKKAQRKAAKLLHESRNSVIAHRNPDALAQLRTIENLKAKDVFGAAEEFYSASHGFMHAFANVLLQAGSFEGLVSFLLNRSQPNK